MKIVFPEMENGVVREAISACPEITAIGAKSLDEGCEMLARGEAEGMIAGIDAATREVILAVKKAVPLTGKYFSSVFLMKRGAEKIVLADGGVCKNPDEEMLFNIVKQTHQTAQRVLDEEPRIAMLSFSTLGSGGEDESIARIKAVVERVRTECLEIIIDGEIQLDAAINERVGKKKAPSSEVAGRANVLICPDLNAGNILYKSMEQFGGFAAAGPILQGFSKPISDLSRGSTVEDIKLVIKTLERLK